MFWKSYPIRRLLSRESDVNAITFNSPDDVMRHAREMIDDAGDGESVKERLRSASQKLGISYGLAKRIRNNEIKEPKTHVFLGMVQRYAAVLAQLEKQSSENTARYQARLRAWGLNETAAANGSADPPTDR